MSKPTGPNNKVRCYQHETQLVRIATNEGFRAVRAWASNGRSRGWHEGVDVRVVGAEGPSVSLQAKRIKELPAWLRRDMIGKYIVDGPCTGVVFRQDRDENFIVLRYTDWLRGLA